MATIDIALEKFDTSKDKVRREIREGFFHPDGTLRVTESELRAWIGDRAVDELKLVLQLSAVIAKAGHLLPARILAQVTDQIADEARHFSILRGLVPVELQPQIDQKVGELPAVLAEEPGWQQLLAAVEAGNPFGALLDVNIVHEGYSAAAIEELAGVPFDDVRMAYAEIGADEERHHETGRELLVWLAGADEHVGTAAATLEQAQDRAGEGAAMSWSWPAASAVADAHERATSGSAMSWSWPAANQA